MATFMDFINAPAKGLRDLIRPVAPWAVTPLSDTFAQMREANPADLSQPISPRGGRRYGGMTTSLDRPADRLSGRGGLTNAPGASRPGGVPAFSATLNPPVNKDAAYYMNLATQQLPGIDFSGLQSRAQTSVADTDARVKAMYKAMRDIQAQEAATRDASRTAAGESIATSATQAATDIQQGYDNAISSLANEMAALGISETLAQEPAQRVAADSGRQQAIATQLGQISGNLNTGMGQADSAFNQQTRDITGLEGVDFRSQLQSDLLNQLAQLDMAQQQQNQQLPMQRMNYAQGLRGYDQSFQPYTPSFSEQLDAQKLAGSQAGNTQKLFNDAFLKFLDRGDDEATALQKAQDYVDYLTSQ